MQDPGPSTKQGALDPSQLQRQATVYVDSEPDILLSPLETGCEPSPALKFADKITSSTPYNAQIDKLVQAFKVASHPDSSIMTAQLSETLFFIRFQDSEYGLPRMKMGLCSNVDSLFGKVADCAQVLMQSILQIAIRFPVDIGRLEKYILLIKPGDQTAFDLLIKTIAGGIVELGPTLRRRYILTATIVRGPAAYISSSD
jgi:hypothetical protein